ncbi:MAG: glycosyltransferase [Deltaproteobacteria bacterium]|nr:glycosyltransferase [Deltaproteobacteria bacterium]
MTSTGTAPGDSRRPGLRLLILQFGDYAEAAHRFARGEDETYYAQRYTVEYVAGLARAGAAVRVVSLGADAPLERLPSGVESMGLRLYRGRFRRSRLGALLAAAAAWDPTHLLLQVPLPELVRWAIRRGVQVLPLLADSFRARGLRPLLRARRLAAALNAPEVGFVANHGPNAAADLVRIGVDPGKVLAFDWPALLPPDRFAAKRAPADPSRLRLVYAGAVTEAKGVGDLLAAVALARAAGCDYHATIAGAGELDAFRARAARRGIADRVALLGRQPHQAVLTLMNAGDVVVVPSRHAYPEGMPMTIYEGLSSRSPVLVSDHPMFRGRVVHRESAVVFPAGSPVALFEALQSLAADAALYARLSAAAAATCAGFFGPLKWDQLITRWLSATADDRAWLRSFALGS